MKMLHEIVRLVLIGFVCSIIVGVIALDPFPLTSGVNRNGANHLVVLCSGFLGSSNNLKYLASKLEESGFVVVRSKSNDGPRSLLGVQRGAERMKEEILDEIKSHPNLKKISFVGNSLGGLYARYALKLFFDRSTSTIHGLEPEYFMVSFEYSAFLFFLIIFLHRQLPHLI
jgi:predicted alpha/beta-fold hydrolase